MVVSAMELRRTLDEVQASCLSVADKRMLWRHAVFLCLGGAAASPKASDDDAVIRMEEVLAAVGEGTKLSIGEAKSRLRALGPPGAALAARIGSSPRPETPEPTLT